jgi:hypothetical protein
LARDRYRRSFAIAQPSMPRPVVMLTDETDAKSGVPAAPVVVLPMGLF